jgi:diacylglycerol kinase family enzyme
MFYYILDPQGLTIEKYERIQVELQGYLSEFKLSGEFARVTTLRTVQDLVDTAASRGAKTIVVCGTDQTFNMVVASLKGRDFNLAFIPLVPGSFLGKVFGVDTLYGAVKTIAARRVESLDVGLIGENLFLSFLEFGITSYDLQSLGFFKALKILKRPAIRMSFRIDDSYNIETEALGGLLVNSRMSSSKDSSIANPTDGFLDLMILEKQNRINALKFKNIIASGRLEEIPNTTLIKCKSVEFLQPRGTRLTMSGLVVAKFPVMVKMSSKKIKVIVGKNRTF